MSFNSTSKELIAQNINGLLSIHESWLRIPMDSVANITNGFAFKSAEFNNRKDGVPLIRIRDVLKGNTSTYYSGQIPEGYWVYPEDLIVGMDGDFNTTIWRSEPALLNQRVCKIEVQEDKYNKRFFYHALPGYLSAINANTSSVTVKHLSSKTLQDTLLPLPPLDEQKIIAEKLDTLLAQVDSTKARLEQIPQILKRFRQAVLSSAVSGKLIDKSFENKLEKLNSFVSIDIGNAFKSSEFSDEGVPLLRGQNIEPGALRWDDTKKFPIDKLQKYSHLFINEGDIILAMDRPIISSGLKIAKAKKSDLPCVLVQRVARFKDFENLIPDYLYLLLNDVSFINYIQPNQTGSDIPHISGKQILNFDCNVPSLPEQAEIVRRVEQLFAYADTIEKQVNNALARVNNLTQSILAKAFRGELTAQWRAENPELISGENSAAALLEKIKAERAASGGKKASRKKS